MSDLLPPPPPGPPPNKLGKGLKGILNMLLSANTITTQRITCSRKNLKVSNQAEDEVKFSVMLAGPTIRGGRIHSQVP